MKAHAVNCLLGALGLTLAGVAVLPAWLDGGLATAWLQLLTLCN